MRLDDSYRRTSKTDHDKPGSFAPTQNTLQLGVVTRGHLHLRPGQIARSRAQGGTIAETLFGLLQFDNGTPVGRLEDIYSKERTRSDILIALTLRQRMLDNEIDSRTEVDIVP